jgi:hypothetical protein
MLDPILQTSVRGVAGAVATVVMTLEQPLDKRLFNSKYDDVEILGKLVTRGDHWQPIGLALHVQNGAIFGAAYAWLKPSLPGRRSSAACWWASSSTSRPGRPSR